MKKLPVIIAVSVVVAASIGAYFALRPNGVSPVMSLTPLASLPQPISVSPASLPPAPAPPASEIDLNTGYVKFLGSSAICDQFHAYYVKQFMKSPGEGLSRMSMPEMTAPPPTSIILLKSLDGVPVASAYSVSRPELIGIAMHDRPVVFDTTKHLPGSRTVTRPLTDFEQKSLAVLYAGRETVTGEDQVDPVLIGAIRAQASCLQCHTGAKIGDILGAFTYELTLIPPSKNDIPLPLTRSP